MTPQLKNLFQSLINLENDLRLISVALYENDMAYAQQVEKASKEAGELALITQRLMIEKDLSD